MLVCACVALLAASGHLVRAQEATRAGYEAAPGLRGRLALRLAPREWSAAAADCLQEEAALLSPWSAAFSAAAGALAARARLPRLYSGARATLPFLAGGAESSGELVRCSAFLANGSSTDVSCSERLPYACFAADPGPASRLWPGYEYAPALRGWLKLHATPRDWRRARLACHLEGAFLTAPWSPEFSAAVRALAARAPARAVHAAVTSRQDYADVAYSYVDGAPVLAAAPAALVRREACLSLLADGAEREVSCSERLPFVCYAPLPPATDPDTTPTPAPLPQRPTTETVTLQTVPYASSPITNPTTTSTSPVPTTSTTVPTTSTTMPPSTSSTSVPSTSTALPITPTTTVPPVTPTSPDPLVTPTTTVSPVTPTAPVPPVTSSTAASDEASPTTAAPFNVCEEMGLAGYQWEVETDQCYRFHAYGAAWPVANATCAAEGTALAVANSDDEAVLFRRLLLRHLRTGIRDASFKGAVALGFYWDGTDWKTVDGKALEASGYAKWWPGWPRAERRAPWGFMEHTGRLENYGGAVTAPFICEAPR